MSRYFWLSFLPGLKIFSEDLEPLTILKIKLGTVDNDGGKKCWSFFQVRSEQL